MYELINQNISNLRMLADDLALQTRISDAIEIIIKNLSQNKPLLICGNGGSASDAQHITGELVGKFYLDRKPLNVICLNSNVTIITAWSNDFEYESVFARQVNAHASNGGVLLVLTTSGNSNSIIRALETAREAGISTIAMTGATGGLAASVSDILINVPSTETPRIQELHLPIYHFICAKIEEHFA
jgi:D-sedoheptulose 7-phosphate isomerase